MKPFPHARLLDDGDAYCPGIIRPMAVSGRRYAVRRDGAVVEVEVPADMVLATCDALCGEYILSGSDCERIERALEAR